MRTLVTFALLLLLALPVIAAREIRVEWEAVEGAASYEIHYGTASGSYDPIPISVADPFVNPDSGKLEHQFAVSSDAVYYVAVKACNSNFACSEVSREVVGAPDPIVTSVDAPSCSPDGTGGSLCTTTVHTQDTRPDCTVSIDYPGVAVTGWTRENDSLLTATFTIAATASGGSAPMRVANPWHVAEDPSISGDAGPVYADAFTIVVIAIPDPPAAARRVDTEL